MRNKIIITAAILATSCSLNDIPLEQMSGQAAFSDSVRVEAFVNELYPYLSAGLSYNQLGGTGSFGGAMFDCVTDLAVYAPTGNCGNVNLFIQGSLNAGSGGNPDSRWAELYQPIRKANIFLNNVKYAKCSQSHIDRMKGEAILMKALCHYELFKRFGGIPIMDNILDLSGNINIPRNTVEETVDYIVRLCDEAAELLPARYPDSDYGRLTKGSAYGAKAMVLLLAASPLYNENPIEGATPLQCYPTPDRERWRYAAEAAKQVLEVKNADGTPAYSLYPDYKSYFFTRQNNYESLIMKQQGMTYSVERADGPAGYQDVRGNTDVSLELVNAFETKNGLLPSEDPTYNPQKPYENRDERFAANILYSGVELWGREVEYFQGGKDYPAAVGNKGCYTGFGMYKHIDPNARPFTPVVNTYHDWPVLRLAEIYLIYAECMNEYLGNSDDDICNDESIYEAVNTVRGRAHQKAIAAGSLTKGQMRELVHRERTVELCFENKRYFDLRRWREAEVMLNQPVHGAKVVKNGDIIEYIYEIDGKPIEIESRTFPMKMYYHPIPQSEQNKNTALEQNPGWI